jgi:hypothetical protein
MKRSIILCLLGLRALGHRLRHDAEAALTVAVAAAVLVAVTAYVFNDFLNVQVASLSLAMRDAFGRAAAVILLVLWTLGSGRAARRARLEEATIAGAARRLGEERGTVSAYVWSMLGLRLVGGTAFVLWIIARYLTVWSPVTQIGAGAAAVVVALAMVWWPERAAAGTAERPQVPVRLSGSAAHVMTRWRLFQLLYRQPMARLALAIAGLGALLVLAAASAGLPGVTRVVAGYAAGLCVATGLALQLADDLRIAWIDRAVGVTHQAFVGVYERLALRLGLGTMVFVGSAAILGALAGGHPIDAAAAQSAIVAAIPVLVMPNLMFQIDARRPALTMLVVLVVSLFIATACYAHWAGVLLLPLLRTFAMSAQHGRFYRA